MSLIVSTVAASTAIAFPDLGLKPTVFDLGLFQLRWYSLAYLAGIFIGYWYLLKLLKQPGAPMARRHADDLVFYAALGIILGGRLGYVLFYNLRLLPRASARHLEAVGRRHDVPRRGDRHLARHPLSRAQGRAAVASRPRLCRLLRAVRPVLRPPRQFREPGAVGRARPTCPGRSGSRKSPPYGKLLGPPRHPSQLYEAGLEGLVLFAILWFMFWRTQARYQPGKLVGAFIFFYGIFRFGIEFVREPDAQLAGFAQATGLHMGQWLSRADDPRRPLSDGDGQEAAGPGRADRRLGQRRLTTRSAERSREPHPRATGRSASRPIWRPATPIITRPATRLGAAGDFTTAPEISQMFGEMVGAALADVLEPRRQARRRRLCRAWPGPRDAGR